RFTRGSEGYGGRRLADHQPGDRVSSACFDCGYLKISTDDGIGINDTLKKVANSILAGASQLRSNARAVAIKDVTRGAQLEEMLTACVGVVGPEGGFVEDVLEPGNLPFFFGTRASDPAPSFGDAAIHFGILQRGQLTDLE